MKLLREIIYGVSILEIKGNTNIAIEKLELKKLQDRCLEAIHLWEKNQGWGQ